MEDIKNLAELPKEVWEELKKNAESMIRNSKIGYYQGVSLLQLAKAKISEFATDDEKGAGDAIKEVLKEVAG